MTLEDRIRKRSLKGAAKIVGAAAVGVGFAYAMNELGVTPWLIQAEINRYALFGEWSRNFAEFMYSNVGRYTAHLGMAAAGSLPSYAVLDRILK